MLLYICQDGDQPSGVGTYGLSMLRHVPDARMLLLNATGAQRALPAHVRERIATVPRDDSHDPARVARAIARVAAAEDDVTLVPNTGDTPWTAAAAWLRGCDPSTRARVRVLGILHSPIETQFAIACHYAQLSPVWTAVSRRCADELRLRVEPLGVEVHELSLPVEMPGEMTIRPEAGPLRLAYVGRLEESAKRVSRLVTLFNELVRRQVDFQATIAGDGPATGRLRAAFDQGNADVRMRVTMTGALSRDEVDALWRATDVCLLVSAFEGLPIVVLEAMAAGACPVVMAVESGLPDLLRDGSNSRMVPQGDVAAMAEALVELSRSRSTLARLQRRARETAAAYAPPPHFKRLAEIVARCWTFPPIDTEGVLPDPTSTAVSLIVRKLSAVNRPVIVYGAGMFGRKVVDACFQAGLHVLSLLDSDPSRADTTYRGLPCRLPVHLQEFGEVSFAVGSLYFSDEIRERLQTELPGRTDRAPVIVTAAS